MNDLNNIELRPARKNDAEQLWLLRIDAIRNSCVGFYDSNLVDRWASLPMFEEFPSEIATKEFLVAESPSEIMGFGGIDGGNGYLLAAFVRPGQQGKGIGRQIVSGLLEIAISRDVLNLQLDSTLNAVEFFESCGFDAVEKTAWTHPAGFEMDCVKMKTIVDPLTYKLKHRVADALDINRVSELVIKSSRQHIAPSLSVTGLGNLLKSMDPEAVRSYFDDAYRFHVLEHNDGSLVAVSAIKPPAHLYYLFVNSNWHGLGLGKKMWSQAKKWILRTTPGAEITVNASLNAVGFYEQIGFKISGEVAKKEEVACQPMVFQKG